MQGMNSKGLGIWRLKEKYYSKPYLSTQLFFHRYNGLKIFMLVVVAH